MDEIIMETIYIRTATEEEECEYVLIDNGNIIKKYYNLVNFTKEVEEYRKSLNPAKIDILENQVEELRKAIDILLGVSE